MSGVIDPKLRKSVTEGGKNLVLTPSPSRGKGKKALGEVPTGDTVGDVATKRLMRRSKSQERIIRSGLGT